MASETFTAVFFVFSTVKKTFDLGAMAKTMAASLVQSRLDYTNSIVHGSTNIRRLETVQNSLARIVLLSNRHLSSNSPLQELHWLPIHSRITFKLVSITYKTLSANQPIYLRSIPDQYTSIRTLRSAEQYLLARRRINTDFGKRAVTFAPSFLSFAPSFLFSIISLRL